MFCGSLVLPKSCNYSQCPYSIPCERNLFNSQQNVIGLKESPLLLLSFRFFYSKVAFCVLDLVFGFESHRIGTALQWFYSLVMDSSTPNVILYCVFLCSFFSLYLMFWQKIRVRSSWNMNYAKISFRPLILHRFVSGMCMWLQQEIRERSHPSSWHDHRLLKCDFFLWYWVRFVFIIWEYWKRFFFYPSCCSHLSFIGYNLSNYIRNVWRKAHTK